jgi:hypothetical protein
MGQANYLPPPGRVSTALGLKKSVTPVVPADSKLAGCPASPSCQAP